jgi:multidrug efflux pump subunit AcrA (membrane-fusion protein)
MSAGDAAAKHWYPNIIELAGHSLSELRLTAAWVMGQDADEATFQRKLLGMLDDPEPIVRRNVALSLAGFGDASGRPVLVSMLRPFTVTTPHEGMFSNRLQPGDLVERGTLLARVSRDGRDEPAEVRSPVPGVVDKRLRQDGVFVGAGDEVMLLGPSFEHVFQALRALYLVGAAEDIDDIRKFRRPREGMPQNVAQQAQLTIDEITRRTAERAAVP